MTSLDTGVLARARQSAQHRTRSRLGGRGQDEAEELDACLLQGVGVVAIPLPQGRRPVGAAAMFDPNVAGREADDEVPESDSPFRAGDVKRKARSGFTTYRAQ